MNRLLASLALLVLAAGAAAAVTPDTGFGGTGTLVIDQESAPYGSETSLYHAHSDGTAFALVAIPGGVIVRHLDQASGALLTSRWASGQTRLGQVDPSWLAYVALHASSAQSPPQFLPLGGGKYMLAVDRAALRFNADGSRDASYGGDGVVEAPYILAPNLFEQQSFRLRADGAFINAALRVSVTLDAESVPVFASTTVLRRWTPAGLPDATLGGTGEAILPVDSAFDLNAPGQILAAADGTVVFCQSPGLHRVLADGTLDATFEANAQAAISGLGLVTPIAVLENVIGEPADTNGAKYVIAKLNYSSWEMHAIRLNADGTLDGTFTPTLLFTSMADFGLVRATVTADGLTVVHTAPYYSTSDDIEAPSLTQVLRVLPAGGIDTGFNGGEIMSPVLNGSLAPIGATVDQAGRVVAYGAASTPGAGHLSQYQPSGGLAMGFGSEGELSFAALPSTCGDQPDGCAALADGRIVMGGSVLREVRKGLGASNEERVKMFLANGLPDAGFGVGGELVGMTDSQGRDPGIEDIGFDAATATVAGFRRSHYPAGAGEEDGLYWYDAEGHPRFGADGLVLYPSYFHREGQRVLADGRLMVCGYQSGEPDQGMILMVLPSGALDPSFASVGYAAYSDLHRISEVVRCDDGSFLAFGFSTSGSWPDTVATAKVMKLNADGSVQTSYGTWGLAEAGTWPDDIVDHCIAILGQGAGDFYFACRGASQGWVRLGHLTAAGIPDPTFAGGGVVEYDLGIGTADWGLHDFKRSASGQMLLQVAHHLGDRRWQNRLVKFTAAGAIDSGYASAGTLVLGTVRLEPPTWGALQPGFMRCEIGPDLGVLAIPDSSAHDYRTLPGRSVTTVKAYDSAGQVDLAFGPGGYTVPAPFTYVINAITNGTGVLAVVGTDDTPDLVIGRFLASASSAPVITSGGTAGAMVGQPFGYTITATNAPTSFGATGLPSGLTIDTASGVISGTPTVTGSFPITITATNGFGTGSSVLTLSVSAAAPVITSPLTANGTEGVFFSYQIVASNAPTSYGATGLPAFLSIDGATGLISGFANFGTSTVIIAATNASGTGNALLSLSIAAPTPVTVTVGDDTVVYDGAAHTLVATASNPAATFAFGYELLNPDRVTYQASSTAAPVAGGTYRVTATAGGGYSGSGVGTLVILPATPIVTSVPMYTSSTTPAWNWLPAGGGEGKYRYKLDGTPDLSTGATTTAATSFIPGSALVDGPHTLYVEEMNFSGDWSVTGSRTVVVDTLGTYSLPIITPPGGDFTGSVTVTLATQVTVGGLTLLFTLDGSDPATSPTAITYAGPMIFGAGEHLRVVARNGASTSPEATAVLRVVGDPTLDVLPPELLLVSAPSVQVGNTMGFKFIHGTPPYSVVVSGASYFTPEAMVNVYDFKKDGVPCAGIWVDVVADRVGPITVTVTDSVARSISATASAVAGGSVLAAPAAVAPSASTQVFWTALSPQTMAGVELLLARAGATDRTQFRGLWYDAPSRIWRDLPAVPVGGQLPMSGFYVASRSSEAFAATGAPMDAYGQIAKLYPGWNLVGIPAVVNGMGDLAGGLPAAALHLLDEDGSTVPGGYPAGMLRIARWNGSSFQHLVGGSSGSDELAMMAESLVCGAAYCVYNGTTTPARPLYLMVDPGSLPMAAPAFVRSSATSPPGKDGLRSFAAGASSPSVNNYAARYGGEPQAPPGAGGGTGSGTAGSWAGLPAGRANGSPVALPASSGGGGGGGCGLGSGLGLVALGGALALAGRLRRRR